MFVLTVCILIVASAAFTSAQDLCDTVGCQNGECVVPATGSPFCNCFSGFRINSDPNVCEDINECAVFPPVCELGYYGYYSYYSGPTGTCQNTPPGSYQCQCFYGPSIGTAKCPPLPVQQQPSLFQSALTYSLYNELFDFELFDF